jgi:hypothetical protein
MKAWQNRYYAHPFSRLQNDKPVIRTNEELIIANTVCRVLKLGVASEKMTGDPL